MASRLCTHAPLNVILSSKGSSVPSCAAWSRLPFGLSVGRMTLADGGRYTTASMKFGALHAFAVAELCTVLVRGG
jgi:hypothetical protein